MAPTGSVNDVFLANSYGKFRLDSTVVPLITVSESEEYYADGKSGLSSKIFEVSLLLAFIVTCSSVKFKKLMISLLSLVAHRRSVRQWMSSMPIRQLTWKISTPTAIVENATLIRLQYLTVVMVQSGV